MKKPITGISQAALARLREYAWPGNIRELENAMERAVALERRRSMLPDSLPEQLQVNAPRATAAVEAVPEDFPEAGFDLERHVQDIDACGDRRGAPAGRRASRSRPPSCWA